jgi:dimethylargininase
MTIRPVEPHDREPRVALGLNRLHAVTREVSRAVGHCELTHLERWPIDVELARAQHRAYEETLGRLGCEVHRLPEEPELPDSVFVEDVALVLDEVAVILRPGAASRRPETDSVARALAPHRRLAPLLGPGTVDGGDVVRVGRDLVVGRSSRSEAAGTAELAEIVRPYGYTVREAAVSGCLHLKSAVTAIGDGTLLIHRAWVDPTDLSDWRLIEVDPGEPYAANALRVEETLVYPATAFPATAEKLERLGYRLEPVDLSELAKAEGAVTCCSLVFSQDPSS